MSRCWYCNEELTTANYCEDHMGICTKCYNSMFKVSNEFVKSLTDKIADLEAKLAESKKEADKYWEFFNQEAKECAELKQQLAEKEQELEDWKDGTIVEKLWHTQRQLSEKEKAYQELLNSIKIKDLSNINFVQVNEDIIRFSESGVIYEYNKKENTIFKIIDKAHQDKISFCIEQLEKVKELIKNMSIGIGIEIYGTRIKPVEEEIDNQIKAIKEMK